MEHPELTEQEQRSGIDDELAQLILDDATSQAPHSPPIILVAENEDSNRHLLEQILQLAGYRCLSATNGLEALKILDREQVDLVLIDLSMPVMDGYQATEIIRKRPDGAMLPIVAVTAYAMSGDRELALRCGCSDYLVKPFRPHDLLDVIERLLRGVSARD